jgi:stearoyl-CoA desaturase (delta-9 desaturase)
MIALYINKIMKYLSASALTVGIMQLVATLGTILGAFYFDFTWQAVVTILISYFIYSSIGLGMMLHRFWTHKSFEFKNDYVKWLFTWIALMTCRGSIIGWVHVHREHHAFSDTEKDPHIQNMSFMKVLFPVLTNHGENVNKRLVRDLLTDTQLDINKYYVAIVVLSVIIFALVSPWVAYFVWFVPVTIVSIVWNSFLYYGHNKTIGYRNHDIDDNSTNSWLFSILLWGEGWHNNHHKHASSWTTKEQPWEIDVTGILIGAVKK